jgi:hypothetical protein
MEYTALDTSSRQIRLLELHPGKLETDLACSFRIISLDDHSARYEALSYVWGASTNIGFIYVEGQRTLITDNLWRALRGLRHPENQRLLWVDALCINQSDDDERSQQVSLMHAIYTQASSVEIWLGESFDNIELASRFFEDFASGVNRAESVCSSSISIGLHADDFDEDALEGDAKKAFQTLEAIQKVMQGSWWQRTWTVQEFVLAKRSTFHCGSHTFDGATLSQVKWHLSNHDQSCCDFDLSFEWDGLLDILFRPMDPFLALKTSRINFVECVGNLRARDATNPRDKIYGLLGLGVNDVADLVQPDYSSPVEKVYENFVISLLARTKNLDVLSHLTTDRQGQIALPSFVPDWTMGLSKIDSDDFVPEYWFQRPSLLDLYNACNGNEVEFKAEPGVLSIRGIVFDTVQSIASGPWRDASTMLLDPSKLDELLEMANIPPKHADPVLKKREKFWAAMCAGILQIVVHRPTRLDDLQVTEPLSAFHERTDCLREDQYGEIPDLLQAAWGASDSETMEMIRDDSDTIEQGRVIGAINIAHDRRRGAVTRGGSIGLVPINARVGDVVAVFTGGRVPIILRPEAGHFNVVGDAYVYGIMDGEAMQDVKELEWIELH